MRGTICLTGEPRPKTRSRTLSDYQFMKILRSKPVPLQNPEAVLNLWAYVDEGGYVFRLAGKAYVIDGNDDEKLSLLRRLSATDFLSCACHKVPANISVMSSDNQQIEALADRSIPSDENGPIALFGPLMEQLAKELPTQFRSVDGEYKPFRVDLPQDPLMVMTVVLEHEDGRLVPMISEE
jgi:hypothetical protein